MKLLSAGPKRLLGAIASVLLFCLPAKASVFPIVTNLTWITFSTGLAFDGSNYLAGLQVGTNLGAQLFSPTGAALGSPILVGTNPSFPPGSAFLFGKTNYLAVWSDTSIGSGVDMFGQFISRSGTLAGPKFNLLQNAGSHQFQTVQALAFDGTNFLLVWQDGGANFYGQIITQGGALSGPEFLISNQPQNGTSAAVAFDGTNYLVVWMSNNNNTGNDNKTYGAFVSRAGSAGAPFQINQTDSVDQNPLAVAFDGTNYLVVWPWDPPPQTEASVTNWDLHARLVSTTGTFPGSEIALVTDPGSQYFPSLAFDGNSYLLSWGDSLLGSLIGTNATLRFQFLSRAAQAIGPEFAIFTPQGTNTPLLTFNGILFDGKQFAIAASLGTVATDANQQIIGFPSGEVFGAFIPASFTPPALALAAPPVGGGFTFQITGTPGIQYGVQASGNLATGPWTTLGVNSSPGGSFLFTDAPPTNSARFYRAAKQ